MSETYSSWDEMGQLTGTPYVHSAYLGQSGFCILLELKENDDKLLRLIFDSPLAIRIMNESERLKTQADKNLEGRSFH